MTCKIQKNIVIFFFFYFVLLIDFVFFQANVAFNNQTGLLTLEYSGQTIFNGILKININSVNYSINTEGYNVTYRQTSSSGLNESLIQTSRFVLSGADSASLYLEGVSQGNDVFPCVPQDRNGKIVRTVSGLSRNRLNNGIYSRRDDWAIHFETANEICFKHQLNNSFTTEVRGREIKFNFKSDYYRKHLGRSYFNPGEFDIRDEAVAGWISWKAYGPYLSEENIKHAADWYAENLLPYGLESFFKLSQ